MSKDSITIGSCPSADKGQTEEKHDFSAKLHALSSVKKVIGIVSGKGGVGKSLVTSLMAIAMNKKGYKTAILDADITGPSIPKAFGINVKALSNGADLLPVQTKTGIEIMSINCLLDNPTDPVIWRGPLIGGVVKQFWSDVIWKDIDIMFIDMPPGTGDVALTVFQSLPVDGIIVVTSPQELVSMIVSKAVNMAKMMNIPILGIVENMSWFKCTECHKEHKIFGDSQIDEIAQSLGIKILARLPIDKEIAQACDDGNIESVNSNWFNHFDPVVTQDDCKTIKIAIAGEKDQVAGHFGHCEHFHIFDYSGDLLSQSQTIPNPGHKPEFLPVYLHEQGVNVIISGGMGGGAVEIFNEKGIEVVIGVQGEAKSIAEQYIKGQLKSTGSICHDHMHADHCGH